MARMKRIKMEKFRKLCTPAQWDEYVEGLIWEHAEKDTFFQKGDRPLFQVNEDGGGSSTPILGWDGEGWSELEEQDE